MNTPCSCGCVERGSTAPLNLDPRVGTIESHDCRPPEQVLEPDLYEDYVEARGHNWRLLFQEIFGKPQEGRHRTTFFAGDYVYKVPHHWRGVEDNEWEAEQRSCHLAACWIQRDADGFPILVMERVDEEVVGDFPDWVSGIDCCQVGISRRTGQLVAYDFGYW